MEKKKQKEMNEEELNNFIKQYRTSNFLFLKAWNRLSVPHKNDMKEAFRAFAKHYHAQQSKVLYTEEEVKNLVIHASGHAFIEGHPEEGTGLDLALKAYKYAHSYWESIKPKK